jgi:hypothetical protein
MIFAKRNTGRTSRMLESARLVAQEGRGVYVIAAHQRHADELRHMLGSDAGRIKVETAHGIGHRLDWTTMTLRGHLRDCVVLVDHYTIESLFGAILSEWVRYEQDSTDTKDRKP